MFTMNLQDDQLPAHSTGQSTFLIRISPLSLCAYYKHLLVTVVVALSNIISVSCPLPCSLNLEPWVYITNLALVFIIVAS